MDVICFSYLNFDKKFTSYFNKIMLLKIWDCLWFVIFMIIINGKLNSQLKIQNKQTNIPCRGFFPNNQQVYNPYVVFVINNLFIVEGLIYLQTNIYNYIKVDYVGHREIGIECPHSTHTYIYNWNRVWEEPVIVTKKYWAKTSGPAFRSGAGDLKFTYDTSGTTGISVYPVSQQWTLTVK